MVRQLEEDRLEHEKTMAYCDAALLYARIDLREIGCPACRGTKLVREEVSDPDRPTLRSVYLPCRECSP